MQAQLANTAKLPQGQRTEAFVGSLTQLFSSPPPSLARDLVSVVQAVVQDPSNVVSQQVLSEFVKRITAVEDKEVRKEAIVGALGAIQARLVSYEEQATTLRELLAQLYEDDEEWGEAAKTLQGIPLETGQRAVQDDYKLATYIRIVRLYLEDDDTVAAESVFNRASGLIRNSKDKAQQLMHKLSHARILDAQRKFNEAGAKYHELSYEVLIEEDERLHSLNSAVTCAILGPAGPQRSRLLATLYRDDRSQDLEHYPILAATFLDQIIRPEQVTSFAASLKPHQLAKLPSTGFTAHPGASSSASPSTAKHAPETVLDRAVMEHNLLSASRLYSNITFEGLGVLLSLTPFAAEAMARTMIQQGRLKGSLDQVERLITFDAAEREVEGAVSNVAAAGDALEAVHDHDVVFAPETLRWDRQIRTAAQAVEDLASRVEALGAMQAPPVVPAARG